MPSDARHLLPPQIVSASVASSLEIRNHYEENDFEACFATSFAYLVIDRCQRVFKTPPKKIMSILAMMNVYGPPHHILPPS